MSRFNPNVCETQAFTGVEKGRIFKIVFMYDNGRWVPALHAKWDYSRPHHLRSWRLLITLDSCTDTNFDNAMVKAHEYLVVSGRIEVPCPLETV